MKAMLPYFTDSFGNPSSIHSLGQEAKYAIEKARNQVAALIGAKTEEIVFTGSGTEADNFAVKGVALSRQAKGNHIIISSIEHHAVLETCNSLGKQGYSISYLPVEAYGKIDPISMSAHKLYGPKGVGALYIRKGTRISSFMHGGNQERGRRASTENAPGIVGFGRAAEIAQEEMLEEAQKLTVLRDWLIEGILGGIEYTQLNGHPVK